MLWGHQFQCDHMPLIVKHLQEQNAQEIGSNREEVKENEKKVVPPHGSKCLKGSLWVGIQECILALEDPTLEAERMLKKEQEKSDRMLQIERDCGKKLEVQVASMKKLIHEEFTMPDIKVSLGKHVADAVNKALQSWELLGIHNKTKA